VTTGPDPAALARDHSFGGLFILNAPSTIDRLRWMDIMRCIAIFLVVLNHAVLQVNTRLPEPLPALTSLNDGVGPFRMATLMFLSGMLLPKSFKKSTIEFVLGKVGGIAWPYLLWSTLLLSLLVTTSGLSGNDSVTAATFLQIFYAPPTYLWYLAYLLVFYVISLLLRSTPRLRSTLIPVALIASQLATSGSNTQRLLYLLAFFLLGDLVARYHAVFENAVRSLWLLPLAAALALVTAVEAGAGSSVRYEPRWVIGVMAGALVLIRISRAIERTKFGVWMASYGRRSIVFYVTHWSAMLIAYHISMRVGIEEMWALFGVLLAAGMGAGFSCIWLERRWSPLEYLFSIPVNRWRQQRSMNARPKKLAVE